MKEIINKVKKSGLEVLDLQDFLVLGERVFFDLKNFLFQELYLKEKDFRTQLDNLNIDKYKDKHIYIDCSVDAIIPVWSYMLIVKKLNAVAKTIVQGNLDNLEQEIFLLKIKSLDLQKYKNKKVIIKGCTQIPIPAFAFTTLTKMLLPEVQSLMYGEPCSTVPIYKRKE